MHDYNEVELTNKGRKVLEDEDIEIPSQLPPQAKISLMAVLAMTKSGLSVSDMVEDFTKTLGPSRLAGTPGFQSADALIESLVLYLVSSGYLRWIHFDEEEPPEAFSDFKDHF